MTDTTHSGAGGGGGSSAPTSSSASASKPTSSQPSREGTPPPLPPRPRHVSSTLLDDRPRTAASGTGPAQPPLQSRATTAVSLTEIQSFNDRFREPRSASPSPALLPRRRPSAAALRLSRSRSGSEVDEATSLRSYVPTLGAGADMESLLGDVMLQGQGKESWKGLGLGQQYQVAKEEALFPEDSGFEEAFECEFDGLDELAADGSNADVVLSQWKSKLKHFLIISSAGKPVYSRHGSDTIISTYVGVIQTIISSYQDPPTSSPLRSFTAGPVRFVVLSKGNLNLVAISRLPSETESQLRIQLESLYMQILSTLTLPAMDRIFANRPSTDLRRPLQGTESLLSALADGFTRGSPSTLLSALECLKLRKSHRQVINSTLMKTRCPSLLYGLIVASGRLVSVVRPKKHSLHPGDLHLIFNMLFEAGSVKAGGGENWIPICLPGFNNTGYLYMYVSFLSVKHPSEDVTERPSTSSGEEEIAILLISTNKESFYELREMRDNLVEQLRANKGLENIRAAVCAGRPLCTDIIPGTPLRHFLYKSRGNVQFTMPSFSPTFPRPLDRRRLMSLYTDLLNTLHARPTQLKIFHRTSTTNITLAWATPLFELLCVAPGTTSRAALAQAANKVVQWVRREEERLFIIGGAVF